MSPSLLERLRARRRARGAAVFIVVLMITALMGVGMFAARSASLSTMASGYNRQALQTHYMAEYAMMLTAAELSAGNAQVYRDLAVNPLIPAGQKCAAGGPPVPCVRVCKSDIDARMASSGQGSLGTFSLGASTIHGDFCVELTGWAPDTRVVPGMTQTFRYYDVTATALGQVQGVVTGGGAVAPSVEAVRGYLVVGPLPQN